eukprot:GHRR01034244.1.p2 GENE.GHRR01034244.1~~GHRR01034244.1.p2  ORF type:complete len:102 (+),score=36.03 GHRR01034244.1:623-928(+)
MRQWTWQSRGIHSCSWQHHSKCQCLGPWVELDLGQSQQQAAMHCTLRHWDQQQPPSHWHSMLGNIADADASNGQERQQEAWLQEANAVSGPIAPSAVLAME